MSWLLRYFKKVQNGTTWITRLTSTVDFEVKGMNICSYAGDPTNNLTPLTAPSLCIDTTNKDLYMATTTASSGWKKITRAT